MSLAPEIRRVVVLDVDGVVSPVRPIAPVWPDMVVAGRVIGPVLVSRSVCTRLDALHRLPGVECRWLTSWTQEMRSDMSPFPGRDWKAVMEADDPRATAPGSSCWKQRALETWLERHLNVHAVAWCDDDLRGGRLHTARRQLGAYRADSMVLAPRPEVGLTPELLEKLETWAARN